MASRGEQDSGVRLPRLKTSSRLCVLVESFGKSYVIGTPHFIYMGHGDNNCTYPVRVIVTIKCDTVCEKPTKETLTW